MQLLSELAFSFGHDEYYCDRCHEWFDEDELDDENQYGDRECPRCGNNLIDEDLYEENEWEGRGGELHQDDEENWGYD